MQDNHPPTDLEHLRFAPEHTWAALGEDGLVTVGITDYAQEQLGEVAWVSLPRIGQETALGTPFGDAESDKTISEIYAPCSGEVVEVNAELEKKPSLLNEDPYGSGWIVRVRPSNPDELDGLLDVGRYRATLEGD